MKSSTAEKTASFEPIAIVGVGTLFPASLTPREFWRNICSGVDLITDVLPSHWLAEDYYDPDPSTPDKTYCKRGSFLPYVDFDPMEYGVPPSVLPAIDTAQLMAMLAAKQALQEATFGQYTQMDLSRVSVILGSSTLEGIQGITSRMQQPIWVKMMREAGIPEEKIQLASQKALACYAPLQENTFPGLLQNVIAGRIANRFNLGGTNCVVDAACASTLAALAMAVEELQSGTADMVLSGGVDALNDIVMFMCFAQTKALSFSGDCRPFSDQADGTILGEGLGIFALKRLKEAEQDQNKIYGIIRGIGSSSDGRHKSIYAPVAKGQSRAILRAYERAGYALKSVELIEAHGTGTRAGDAAEFEGLNLAFQTQAMTDQDECALGSVKSQIGHAKAAAGAAGLFKALMALHHKVLPPTIKVDKPNSQLNFEHSPLYLNTRLRPWVSHPDHPRRAGVSSFGFGGSNFHVTLEEYNGPCQAPRLRTFSHELLLYTAETPEQLLAQLEKALSILPQYTDLAALAYENQQHFQAQHPIRLAVVAETLSQLTSKLQQAVSLIRQAPQKSFSLLQGLYYGAGLKPGKVAFLFPGAGSQYLHMGQEMAMHFPACMQVWDEANQVTFSSEKRLSQVVFPRATFSQSEQAADERRLNEPSWAYPAVVTTSLAYLAFFKTIGIEPDYALGPAFKTLTPFHQVRDLSVSDWIQQKTPGSDLMACQPALEQAYAAGVRTFVEVGPKTLFSGLATQILSQKEAFIVSVDRKQETETASLWNALGYLTTLGLNPDFSALWQAFEKPLLNSASAAAEEKLTVKINGTNYGKPYPRPTVLPVEPTPESSPETLPLTIDETNDATMNLYLLQLYQTLQQQLIESQSLYQKAMGDSHLAFLNTMQQLIGQLNQAGQGETGLPPTVSVPPAVTFTPAPVAPVAPAVVPTAPRMAAPVAAPVAPTVKPVAPAPVAPPVAPRVAPPAPPVVPAAPAVVPVAAAPKPPVAPKTDTPAAPADVEAVLMEVIVEKTGYPAKMLKMDMAIEADLGIDSIKRVEILSAVTKRVPGLPEVKPEDLTKMVTLGDIVNYIKQH